MKKFISACLGRTCSPPQKRGGGVKNLTDRQLRILFQMPDVTSARKRLIERELIRRNKKNYGYELAKMFGETPPPTNKIRVSHANVIGRIMKEGGVKMNRVRMMFDPSHGFHFSNFQHRRHQKPETKLYRAKRKSQYTGFNFFEGNRMHPTQYRNMTWRFYAIPLAHRNHKIFYETRNSVPFMINKKSGARRPVPARLLQGGVGNMVPRNMNRNTLNSYSKRVNQYAKQVKSLKKSNNYATGRSNNKPNNSSLRFYFEVHPRATQTGARTVENIQRELKNRIANNLIEHMSVPTNQRLFRMLENIPNATNMKNLVRRMNAYKKAAGNTWSHINRHRFDTLYQRALSRNKYGIHYR